VYSHRGVHDLVVTICHWTSTALCSASAIANLAALLKHAQATLHCAF
jgi:hypothetical protein